MNGEAQRGKEAEGQRPELSIIVPFWSPSSRCGNRGLCMERLEEMLPAPTRVDHEVLEITPDVPEQSVNKSKLLNRGIERSTGRILMFLDADMLVGPLTIASVLHVFRREPRVSKKGERIDRKLVQVDHPTRLCFRVHKLPEGVLESEPGQDYPLGYEAYESPDRNLGVRPWAIRPEMAVFGNSQFAMLREDLGDLRFDEDYVGHGFHDLDFIQQVWRKFGDDYRGQILTDAGSVLHHLWHDHDPAWHNGDLHRANLARYRKKWGTPQ